MACPACDHTMQSVGDYVFWCLRCGTIKDKSSTLKTVNIPWAVERADALLSAIEQVRDGNLSWREIEVFERSLQESVMMPAERG